MIKLFKIEYDLAPPIMGSMLNRRTICYNLQELSRKKFARVLVGKKENIVLWFRSNKLPCIPIIDNFAGSVQTKEHSKSV